MIKNQIDAVEFDFTLVQFKGMTMDIKPFMKDNSTARFSVPVTGG